LLIAGYGGGSAPPAPTDMAASQFVAAGKRKGRQA
jgi:hypothetical protein